MSPGVWLIIYLFPPLLPPQELVDDFMGLFARLFEASENAKFQAAIHKAFDRAQWGKLVRGIMGGIEAAMKKVTAKGKEKPSLQGSGPSHDRLAWDRLSERVERFERQR